MRTQTEETRARLGRVASTLASKRGPLSAAEMESLRSLFQQFEELESEIRTVEEKRYYRAFTNYLRFGYQPSMRQSGISVEDRAILDHGRELFSSPTTGTFSANGAEFRDLSVGTGAAYPGSTGGFFIPALFVAKVESAMTFYSRLLALANVVDTQTGAPQGYPEDNDANIAGEMVPEFTQTTEQDVPISETILKSFKFGSRITKVSVELLQDAGFPLDDYLADRFAIRLARAMNPKFTSGQGTVEPTGFITRAAIGATAVGSAENSGNSDGTNTIGSSDLSNLVDSVDAAYRVGNQAVFVMHPNTLGSLRRLRDQNGFPVFWGLHDSDGVDTIYKFRVELDADMDQLQTGSPSSPPVTRKTVAFGDFKKFVIRRAPQMLVRMDTRFSDFGQIGFLLWQRADSNLIDGGGGAIKVLANVY